MKWLARFSIENSAFNHVLTVLIIAIGSYALITIPQELNPLVDFNWLFVTSFYPGASPREVEQEVTIPIEDNIDNLEDLDFYTSESYEGLSMLFIRFEQISDDEFDRRVQDVRNAVDEAELPEGAEVTDYHEFSSYDLRPVVEVAVFGDVPTRLINDATRDLRRRLLRMQHIGNVLILGLRDREIRVELDPLKMRYYKLSAQQVVQAIQARNLNLPGGSLKVGPMEYLVRTQAEYTAPEEIAGTIIASDPTGLRVTVGDVASVGDAYSDPTVLSRFEDRRCQMLTITKTEQGNSLRIVRAIRRLVDDVRRTAPDGLHYAVINDSTVEIEHNLNILKSNALLGLMLVMVLLCLFLGWRSALAAALGIPISFLLTMAYLRLTGETLNQSSLFALVLVLGMVVDDAIVIVENCHTKLHEGKLPPMHAILEGVQQVSRPVIVSSLTTIFGFLPLMLMPGVMGRMMRVIPLVVCVTLLASLFEAFVILPGHVDSFSRLQQRRQKTRSAIRLVWLQKGYVKLLVRCLRHRYLFLGGVFLLLVLSMGLAGLLGFDLFAEDDLPSFKVLVHMPGGTRIERTEEVLSDIERAVRTLPEHEVESVSIRAGIIQGREIWTFSPATGQVTVNLAPHHRRDRSVDASVEEIRQRVAGVAGPRTVEFQVDSQGPPAGVAIEILIKGRHLDGLEQVNDELQRRLREIPGLRDIRDDLDLGTQELNVRIDPDRARRYGLTVHHVASELRTALNGTTATVIHDGDEDVDVVVRFRAESRAEIAHVLATYFRTPAGEMVAFEDIASLREETGYSNIRRHNNERAITVRADVDKSQMSLSEAVDQVKVVMLDIERRYTGYKLSIWGQWKEFVKSFNSLGLLFALGLMFIYLLLVGQFRSLIQPLVILTIVPLSFIGAALGLLVLQRPVTIATMYGFVALAGVAVNDSIVLVDFINNLRKRLTDRRHSLVMAGQQRLRPVILTSVTTIVGLLPMAIGLGGSTGAWQSLAVTIVAGLVFATVISLFGIPVMINVTDDLKAMFARSPAAEPEPTRIIVKSTTPRPPGEEAPAIPAAAADIELPDFDEQAVEPARSWRVRLQSVRVELQGFAVRAQSIAERLRAQAMRLIRRLPLPGARRPTEDSPASGPDGVAGPPPLDDGRLANGSGRFGSSRQSPSEEAEPGPDDAAAHGSGPRPV